MDTVSLTPAQVEFLGGRHYATLATLDDDGAPRQAVIWYRLEADGRLLINSRLPRKWPRNLLRDGRAAIAIPDVNNGLRWLGFTGVVDEVVDEVAVARDHIMELAHRYSEDGTVDEETETTFRSQQRITFLIRLTSLHDHLED